MSLPTSFFIGRGGLLGGGSEVLFNPNTFGSNGYGLWTVPAGVESISIVVVGGGGSGATGNGGGAGGGGGLAYVNSISVFAGEQLQVQVGKGGDRVISTVEQSGSETPHFNGNNGVESWVARASGGYLVRAGGGSKGESSSFGGGYGGAGGNPIVGTGGSGGRGGSDLVNSGQPGGGGAGGYSGDGGAGTTFNSGSVNNANITNATNGAGGAGGGGGGSHVYSKTTGGGAGGGVGVYGLGSSGLAGTTYPNWPGGNGTPSNFPEIHGYGGSGGQRASWATVGVYTSYTTLGDNTYGGGGGGSNDGSPAGAGANGVVRIIWGDGRAFPSTLVDLASSPGGQTVY